MRNKLTNTRRGRFHSVIDQENNILSSREEYSNSLLCLFLSVVFIFFIVIQIFICARAHFLLLFCKRDWRLLPEWQHASFNIFYEQARRSESAKFRSSFFKNVQKWDNYSATSLSECEANRGPLSQNSGTLLPEYGVMVFQVFGWGAPQLPSRILVLCNMSTCHSNILWNCQI